MRPGLTWAGLFRQASQRLAQVAIGEAPDDTLSVDLADGRTITVPLVWYPRLLQATPAQRANWEVVGAGYGIHWPDVDEDLSSEGLLRGAPAPHATVGTDRLRWTRSSRGRA